VHIGVSFPPTLQRRHCQLTRWEGTPPASRNLQSTTFEHISVSSGAGWSEERM
jgi:hypothetical protein